MRESVKLYGFGSFFSSFPSTPRDVDVLIVHERVDSPSINFAIRCKSMLGNFVPIAHITTLSESEEHELNFIERSNALLLGQVTDIETAAQLATLASRLSAKYESSIGASDSLMAGIIPAEAGT